MNTKNIKQLKKADKHVEKANRILKEVYLSEREMYHKLASQVCISRENDSIVRNFLSLIEYERDLKLIKEKINELIEKN